MYSYSHTEPNKQKIARKLISETASIISTQVIQELCNIITKKFKFSHKQALVVIEESCQNNFLHINTQKTISSACEIAERYSFSFYDSLILAAALEAHCTILYSEDLQHNQKINNQLTIINPFV